MYSLVEDGRILRSSCGVLAITPSFSLLSSTRFREGLEYTVYVLVKDSIAVMKHHDHKASWGGKGLLGSHCQSSSLEVRSSSRAGTWRQELMQRPWKSVAFWLTPHDLLNLLSDRTQNHQPRDGPIHNGLGPPPSISN